MKVHRIVLMVIDFDELGAEGVKDALENARYPNRCIAPAVMDSQTVDIGPWADEHPLNNSSTDAAEFARLFTAALAVSDLAKMEGAK